jgi:hypothetical protein
MSLAGTAKLAVMFRERVARVIVSNKKSRLTAAKVLPFGRDASSSTLSLAAANFVSRAVNSWLNCSSVELSVGSSIDTDTE